jgi:hypothetical protein
MLLLIIILIIIHVSFTIIKFYFILNIYTIILLLLQRTHVSQWESPDQHSPSNCVLDDAHQEEQDVVVVNNDDDLGLYE